MAAYARAKEAEESARMTGEWPAAIVCGQTIVVSGGQCGAWLLCICFEKRAVGEADDNCGERGVKLNEGGDLFTVQTEFLLELRGARKRGGALSQQVDVEKCFDVGEGLGVTVCDFEDGSNEGPGNDKGGPGDIRARRALRQGPPAPSLRLPSKGADQRGGGCYPA
eukprot:5041087-Pleurochrysis_carterae.AAC.5